MLLLILYNVWSEKRGHPLKVSLLLAGVFCGSPILKFGLSETIHDINLFTGKPRVVLESFTFNTSEFLKIPEVILISSVCLIFLF
jgi:hypothetical protein